MHALPLCTCIGATPRQTRQDKPSTGEQGFVDTFFFPPGRHPILPLPTCLPPSCTSCPSTVSPRPITGAPHGHPALNLEQGENVDWLVSFSIHQTLRGTRQPFFLIATLFFFVCNGKSIRQQNAPITKRSPATASSQGAASTMQHSTIMIPLVLDGWMDGVPSTKHEWMAPQTRSPPSGNKSTRSLSTKHRHRAEYSAQCQCCYVLVSVSSPPVRYYESPTDMSTGFDLVRPMLAPCC